MDCDSLRCRRTGHQQYDATLICTLENCDKISRYMCKQCINENLHKHNQENSNHIMDLQNLCQSILNRINQHKANENLQEQQIKYLDELELIYNTHYNCNNQIKHCWIEYDYVCTLLQNGALKFLVDVKKSLPEIQNICVQCFNEEEHDHQKMLTYIQQFKKDIKGLPPQPLYIVSQFKSLYKKKKLCFQEPNYNKEKINRIEQIIKSRNQQIDYEQLIQLIFIKNSTHDQGLVQKVLQKIILRFGEMRRNNQAQQKIKYYQKICYDKILFYQLQINLPQFIVSSNEQYFIFQDKNNSLVVGDLQTLQIKKIQLLNRIIRMMKLSKDMKYLFCSDDQGYLLCFKTKNSKQMFKLQLYLSKGCALLPINNNEIIIYSKENIKIINFNSQKLVIRIFFKESIRQNFQYYQHMNDEPNPIEYDEKQQIIFLGGQIIEMRCRQKLQLKQRTTFYGAGYTVYQLQIMKNNNYLLSGFYDGLRLWKYDQSYIKCIKEYECYSQKFQINENNKQIILMGKCFFEILNYNLQRVKIGNFDCHPSQFKIIGRKFQIEENNSCYIILISENQIQVQKRVLSLQDPEEDE